MKSLPAAMFKHWGHSFEEDYDDVKVYRPSTYDFPLARGRAGLEIRADGSFIDWAIGPTDAPQEISGYWHLDDTEALCLTYQHARRAPQRLDFTLRAPDLLEVRIRPSPD
jgi:hypothetical protein